MFFLTVGISATLARATKSLAPATSRLPCEAARGNLRPLIALGVRAAPSCRGVALRA